MDSMKDHLQKSSNADEYLLHQTLHFVQCLKELRSIRAQMYSAADHFEECYFNNKDHHQLVEETLKDYICEALISTVDHLGSIVYKFDRILDEKVDEISSATLQFSVIEQRLRAHQQFINLSALSYQSLVPDTATHYKRYKSAGLKGHDKMKSKSFIHGDCPLYPQDDSEMQHYQDTYINKAFQVPGSKCNTPSSPRKILSRRRSAEVSPNPQSIFSMRAASIKEIGKRAVSPLKLDAQRSGSVATRSTFSGDFDIQQQLSNSKPISKGKDIVMYSRKSKHLFREFARHTFVKKAMCCQKDRSDC